MYLCVYECLLCLYGAKCCAFDHDFHSAIWQTKPYAVGLKTQFDNRRSRNQESMKRTPPCPSAFCAAHIQGLCIIISIVVPSYIFSLFIKKKKICHYPVAKGSCPQFSTENVNFSYVVLINKSVYSIYSFSFNCKICLLSCVFT